MVDQLIGTSHIPFSHRTDLSVRFDQREKKTEICSLFDQYGLDTDATVLIGCSGGPDSMLLTSFLVRYRHIVKGLPLSITKILHINHGTSPSDDQAEKLITSFYSGAGEIVIKKIPPSKTGTHTETSLRKQRRAFFVDCITTYTSLQGVYLCLGHHLDDRIENSFLHFDRGTHLKGIGNMSAYEKRYHFHTDGSTEWVCCRPFLSVQKAELLAWCKELCLPYVIDSHNSDRTSQRIVWRDRIKMRSGEHQEHFYTDRSYVYTYIESQQTKFPILVPAKKSPFWDIEELFQTPPPRHIEDLVVLLDLLGIYTNISTKRLEEMMKWFGKSSGSRYIQGRRFLLSYGQLYLARQHTKKKFREPDQTWGILTKQQIVDRGGFDRPITNYTSGGYLLTVSQKGDRYGSGSFTRRANKQRIPFFWRRSLPIIKKNHIVYEVLPREYRPWISSCDEQPLSY